MGFKDIVEYDYKLLRVNNPDQSVGAIFGSCVWFADDLDKGVLDYRSVFEDGIIRCAENAYFFKWSKGVVDAIKTFCRLLSIDHKLVEAYYNMPLEELAEIAAEVVEARTIRA